MKIIKHLILYLLLSVTTYAGAPPIFSYQGYLADIDGNPVIENKSVTFSIYTTEDETTPLWQEIHLIVPDQFGQFAVLLGSQTELNNSVFNGSIKYLGIKIEDNPEMKPRQQINSVPYAISSNISENSITTDKILDGTILLDDINQNMASAGQIIKWDGSKWIVANDLTGTDNQGNITTVIAGTGLSGGGSSDTITLAIEPESISAEMIQNNSITNDKIVDSTILLDDINQNMASAGQIIKWDGSKWIVANDLTGTDNQGDITTVIAGEGLSGGGSSDTITLAIEPESISADMIQNNSITNEDINSNAQIDISKISNGASLQNDQIFNGNNTFNESIDAFQGTTQNYAIKAENNYGGFGIVCQTNSDTNPALKVITGITEPAQASELSGLGPLIEAWSASVSLNPSETIVEKRFVVENNGDVFADGAFTGGGADFAELIEVSDNYLNYETGDLMVIDIDTPNRFKISNNSNSHLVAGVYSSNPGFIGHDKDNNSANNIPMALVGIVPCKVTNENGAINIGDLLVSSNFAGHAMKADNPQTGTII
ncbi:MAG: hypothetical protein U9N54_05815, partial [candidate division Zixibacteria bacterium]|nr:hypothetical protein [candidate division Zixibacteria bacterium]